MRVRLSSLRVDSALVDNCRLVNSVCGYVQFIDEIWLNAEIL
jgi:hypothetical protein